MYPERDYENVDALDYGQLENEANGPLMVEIDEYPCTRGEYIEKVESDDEIADQIEKSTISIPF